MIAKEYKAILKGTLSRAHYLLLILVVGCLQRLQDMRLERIGDTPK